MTSITELWGLTPYRPRAWAASVSPASSSTAPRQGLMVDNLLTLRAIAHDMARIGLRVPASETAFLTEVVEGMYNCYSRIIVPALVPVLVARGDVIPPFPPCAASWREEATAVDGDALLGALLPHTTTPHMKEVMLHLAQQDRDHGVHWASRACSHVVIRDLWADCFRAARSGDGGAMPFVRQLLADPTLASYANAILSPHLQRVSDRSNALFLRMRERPLESGWRESEAVELVRRMKGPPLAMYEL